VTEQRGTLKEVSSSAIERLRTAIVTGQLKTPVDRAALLGCGIRHQLDAIEATLAGHRSAACLAILDVVLAEREVRRPTPQLVWTGPEEPGGTARDTAVVLRELFEGARESVILAGYSFDHAAAVLAPLHAVMRDHGVKASFFVNIPQVDRPDIADGEHLVDHLGRFVQYNWPFGAPVPALYYDKRALVPGPPFCSLHAKCVVVDGARAFVSSANFTQRGQDRNIEVGVLIEDPSFASYLAGQWLGLIDAGIVGEYRR
jgi:phosphatidylserine/phosphatidylglycerophosphate/cardiolipin synthase-like enzyme